MTTSPAEGTVHVAREERCDWSDLPKYGCAHCRGHRPDPDLIPADRDDDGDRRIIVAGDVGTSFTARYDGRCAACGGRILADETVIARLTDGPGVVCSDCLP